MRRNLISATAVNRFVSAKRQSEKERQGDLLIGSNGGYDKERPPQYTFERIDFHPETRNAKIIFLETKKYRTIEKYVKQNYVKHPIYSEWKTKTKEINKSIKLTNHELEHLNQHEDELIQKHAVDIVAALNNSELFPSWFLRFFLNKEHEENVTKIEQEFSFSMSKNVCKIDALLHCIYLNDDRIYRRKEMQGPLLKEIEKLQNKISKIENAKRSRFLSVLTFGIYGYLVSQRRIDSLCQRQNARKENVTQLEEEIARLEEETADLHDQKKSLLAENEQKEKEKASALEREKERYQSALSLIEPLSDSCDEKTDFVLLKSIVGFEYKKIIGCYVIHNRENDRCYVGQSKDVLRRLKQHFRGTAPHNIIFAEDYYASSFENKEDLFEVKIIPCSTKDELDKTERDLIAEYDAWRSGYNGTSGNT